jgi:DNA-binding transcriptional LysR family regulator
MQDIDCMSRNKHVDMQNTLAHNARMDTETLSLFVEVMRHGSFADVARNRGVAPSSISRAIAGLEQELGIRLFQRTTRKLEPTEAGVVYFERVAPLIAELASARQVATDVTEEPRGILRVTAPVVFGQLYLVPLLPALAQRYPNLSIELLLSDAYLDLIEDRIDIAIRLGSLRDSSYIATRLRELEFYICASPAYLAQHGAPATPQQIGSHNCLLFPRTGYNLNWLFRDRDGNVLDIPIHGNCLITNSQAIRQCALAGMGLTLLPDWLIQEDVQSGALVRLFAEYDVTASDYDSAAWLLYPSRDYLALKTRMFIDHLVSSMRGTND